MNLALDSSPAQSRRPSIPESPDACLRTVVHSALKSTGYRVLSLLVCEVTGDTIVLSGVVTSFYLKQVAQSAALRAVRQSASPARLENRIDVQDP